ncbi:hypothetical protein S83_016889, partial [Arachis hypogaea]
VFLRREKTFNLGRRRKGNTASSIAGLLAKGKRIGQGGKRRGGSWKLAGDSSKFGSAIFVVFNSVDKLHCIYYIIVVAHPETLIKIHTPSALTPTFEISTLEFSRVLKIVFFKVKAPCVLTFFLFSGDDNKIKSTYKDVLERFFSFHNLEKMLKYHRRKNIIERGGLFKSEEVAEGK